MIKKIPKAQCRKCAKCKFILESKVVCDMQLPENEVDVTSKYVPMPEYCAFFEKRGTKNERKTEV